MDSGYSSLPITLRGGLDLNTPRTAALPGTLKACLNYKTYGVAGYSVVNGIERYDGTHPCFMDDWLIATGTSGGPFTVGEALKDIDGNIFGVCAYYETNILHYLITNRAYAPQNGDDVEGVESANVITINALTGIKQASKYYSTQLEFLDARKLIYETIRGSKQSIFSDEDDAKNIIPHGLHWFRGQLYSIIDSYTISFDTGAVRIYPGDLIRIPSNNREARVLDIKVTTGDWSSGTAAGLMMIRVTSNSGSNPNAFDIPGAISVIRPNGATGTTVTANAFNLVDYQLTTAWASGIYYSAYDDELKPFATAPLPTTERQWRPLDMGWEANFATDNTTLADGIPTVFRGNYLDDALTTDPILGGVLSLSKVATSQVLTSGTLANPFGPGSTTQPASTAISTVLGDSLDATYVQYAISAGAVSQTSAVASLTTYDFSTIPDGSVITGFGVEVRTQSQSVLKTASVSVKLRGTRLNQYSPQVITKTKEYASGAITTYTLGGNTDMWGTEGVSSPDLLDAVRDDSTFGVQIQMLDDPDALFANRLYQVNLTVYYRPPVKKVYAFDPITLQDIQVDIPYYNLAKGQFNPGANPDLYGEGKLVFYNLTPLDDTDGGGPEVATTSNTIKSGWQLRDARAGAGTLIALITSDMVAQYLPTRLEMESAKKRFQIINSNYYAHEDWDAFYGVSGLSAAFQYDGIYFYKYYTELTYDEDRPSTIAAHRGYNCLGYDSGQLIVSVPNEPTNFDSVQGAILYPTGDRITGLLSLNGTALSILCESSIYALTGDVLGAYDDNNAVMQVISPYSGAIAYTAIDAGGIPMFCDFRGVSTIQTTEKYGDFENGRISWKISPYLKKRSNSRFSFASEANNIMFAVANKADNLYQLFMADGDIISCALPIADRDYEFTRQQYNFPDTNDKMVPVCVATGTSKLGSDLMFGTFKVVQNDTANPQSPKNKYRESYVYKLNSGVSFDSFPIYFSMQLNFTSAGTPAAYELVRNAHFEILCYNHFRTYYKLASDYREFGSNQNYIDVLPQNHPITTELVPTYVTAKLEGRGVNMSMEIGGQTQKATHVIQAVILDFIPGKTQLGEGPKQTIAR